MLVMRRRAGESFLIGPDIEIEVLEVGHTRVRIGISAPGSVAIVRKEIALTREENMTAARRLAADEIARLSRRLRSAAELTDRQKDDDAAPRKIFDEKE